MYFYFDSKGTLKEMILEPLRSGDSGRVIYAYVEDTTPTSCWMQYELTDGTYYYPISALEEGEFVSGVEIEYDKDRDLKYFKYNTPYRFMKFTIPDDVLQDIGAEPDHTNTGCINIEIEYEASNEISNCQGVPVMVEKNANSVIATQSINLAQWNEVLKWKNTQTGYTAGTGINITNKVISVNNTVATKTDLESKQDTLSESQMATVNSGITAGDFNDLAESKQDNLPTDKDGVVAYSDGLGDFYISQAYATTTDLNNALKPTSVISATITNNKAIFTNLPSTKAFYIITFGYTTTVIPVYENTLNQIYKIAGTFLYNIGGSAVTTTINYKLTSSTTLEVWSGNSNYAFVNGFTAYLLGIKLN